jgi:multicomponent Na+:H+ antiporter subunit E
MNKLSLYSLSLSFISLMLFWVVMSGFFDAVHLTMGVLSVAGVMAINHKLKVHRFFSDDMNDLKEIRYFRAVFYFFWMIYQIVVAGFHVVKIIFKPSLPTKLSIVRFKADLPSSHAKVILGNSITLTPGTLTVDIEGDHFLVHALDESSYKGIISDEMPREVLKLFQKEARPVISDVKITTKEYTFT